MEIVMMKIIFLNAILMEETVALIQNKNIVKNVNVFNKDLSMYLELY